MNGIFKINDRVIRSALEPLRQDEKDGGLLPGDEGVTVGLDMGSAWVIWDGAPGQVFFYGVAGNHLEAGRGAPVQARISFPPDPPPTPKVCCDCSRSNDYRNGSNCDKGWRCGECRGNRKLWKGSEP